MGMQKPRTDDTKNLDGLQSPPPYRTGAECTGVARSARGRTGGRRSRISTPAACSRSSGRSRPPRRRRRR
uniref:Uncharacterized protein n=1 Tax=Zea mays TaxID=4577 RepID=C0PE45_MAIZE|nr:unknown [Zea mays]